MIVAGEAALLRMVSSGLFLLGSTSGDGAGGEIIVGDLLDEAVVVENGGMLGTFGRLAAESRLLMAPGEIGGLNLLLASLERKGSRKETEGTSLLPTF